MMTVRFHSETMKDFTFEIETVPLAGETVILNDRAFVVDRRVFNLGMRIIDIHMTEVPAG